MTSIRSLKHPPRWLAVDLQQSAARQVEGSLVELMSDAAAALVVAVVADRVAARMATGVSTTPTPKTNTWRGRDFASSPQDHSGLKVLFVTPDLFGAHGGIARHCRVMLKALSESPQVELVDVISLRDTRGTPPDPIYFGQRGRSYHPCARNRHEFVYRVTAARLRTGYDVVIAGHVNLTPPAYLPLPGRVPPRKVALIYGTDAWVRLPFLRRASLRAADLVFSMSQFTADTCARINNILPQKVAVTYGCLDPNLSDCGAPADHDTQEGPHSLLTVSRLSLSESSKGQIATILSLVDVVKSVPDVRYDVVGDGDLKPALVQLTAMVGLGQHVRFHGPVSDERLRELYHGCTAYVMPSKWEGFGLVFLEAMAHARPIIAGRRDATPEVLQDAALLVDPNDRRELSAAILSLLSNADLRVRLGAAGRARLIEHFTYDRFRTFVLAQLETAVGRRAPDMYQAAQGV